jgi:2-iminobutanoate/2-iminopropanoate deaminase
MRQRLFRAVALPLAAVMACASAAAAHAEAPAIRYFPHPGAPKPFSSAVRVGNLVYVSGVTGIAADGTWPADFSVQATNAMDALAGELKLAGASLDDVYKCNIALTDMANWAAFNSVYTRYFKQERLPVRMAVGVVSLGGAGVEVQCEAALR